MKGLDLCLEIPFNEYEARNRGIDPSLCKIICKCPNDYINCVPQLVTAVDRCVSIGEDTNVMAIGEAKSTDSLQLFDDIEIHKMGKLVRAKSENALGKVIFYWCAESLVIFSADIEVAKTIASNAELIEEQWWRYKRGGGPDKVFLGQMELCKLFIFYNSTYQSLEIIGYEEQISKCYEYLKVA